MKKRILFLLVLGVLSACKDPLFIPPGLAKKIDGLKLTEINFYNGERIITLHYDKKGRLTESRLNGKPQYRFVYNAKGQIAERWAFEERPLDTFEGTTYFPYRFLVRNAAGQIIEERQPWADAWENPSAEPGWAYNYDYDQQGRLTKRFEAHRGHPRDSRHDTFTYIGNILTEVMVDQYGEGDNTSHDRYHFDGGKSLLDVTDYFLFEGGILFGEPTSPGRGAVALKFPPIWATATSGNVTKIEVTTNSFEPYEYTLHYRWEYGSHGYPVKFTGEGTDRSITFSYNHNIPPKFIR